VSEDRAIILVIIVVGKRERSRSWIERKEETGLEYQYPTLSDEGEKAG